jgi:hypothetical protein
MGYASKCQVRFEAEDARSRQNDYESAKKQLQSDPSPEK